MNPRHVHFIGIAGVGMSATALLLKEAGWIVTGSDAECYGPPKDILAAGGLVPRMPYSPENIPSDVDCFVIGRNAKLAPEINEEVRAAHESGKHIYSFPEILGEITQERANVVVVGSYGKSTTTTLVAHILRHAGVDAGYFIGAEPATGSVLTAPSGIGSALPFVLEGDEYPSAHDDARAKFMHLHPTDVVLTSVVHDHVNVYPTYEDYQKPFTDLLALVPHDGVIIACADEAGSHRLAASSGKRVVSYGVDEGEYRATHIVYGNPTRFELVTPEGTIALSTTQLGKHNVEDIVAASAYVLTKKLVTREALAAAVAAFPGVRRRLDNIAPTSSLPVLEGFGSSYEKARAAIEAMLLHFKDRRLVVVFEPHTFGWRNVANLPWYDSVFTGVALVLVAHPATQGADTHDQLSYEQIMQRISATGTQVATYSPEDVHASVRMLDANDAVLVLTSGDLEGTLETFAAHIAETFPA